jgi:hypothetical protein
MPFTESCLSLCGSAYVEPACNPVKCYTLTNALGGGVWESNPPRPPLGDPQRV